MIAVSKSCCPVCWVIIEVFNQITQEENSKSATHIAPVRFNARGRHLNLYPVDLPDILDDAVKDELLRRFSIILLENLIALLDKDASAAKAKHVHSDSNVSQPESVAFSVDSTLGGSIDVGSSQANQEHITSVRRDRMQSLDRVHLWVKSSTDLGQPEP